MNILILKRRNDSIFIGRRRRKIEYNKKVLDVFMRQKSAVAAVTRFTKEFMDIYRAEGRKEKDLLEECIRQMFHRYYYSPLVPDIPLSPQTSLTR